MCVNSVNSNSCFAYENLFYFPLTYRSCLDRFPWTISLTVKVIHEKRLFNDDSETIRNPELDLSIFLNLSLKLVFSEKTEMAVKVVNVSVL